MRKRETAARQSKRRQYALMRDGAQSEDRAEPSHAGDFGDEKTPTSRDFAGLRLVRWGRATHRVGDAGTAKLEVIVPAGAISPLREAKFPQCGVQQFPGVIAGERAAGSVRSAQTRCQTDNQQFRVVIAKRWDRRIEPLRMRAPLDLAKVRQTRA
jgi:hypothetical protein